jgi:DNA-binding transcriptional LysR family regulator
MFFYGELMSRLDELLTFVEVVNLGSFTRAAERLGIVKSAVSRRIIDLEDRLKVRSTAGMSVTEAGMTFYARVSRIVADLDDAELSVTGASSNLTGAIRATAPVSLTNLVLMPKLSAFLQMHPALKLELHLSDRSIDIINEGYDLAIRAGTLSDSRLVARKLTSMPRITCASPAYLAERGCPNSPQDLANHNGLRSTTVPKSLYWNYQMPDGGTYQANPPSVLEVNNGEAVVSAAIAGVGIAAVPVFLCSNAIEKGCSYQFLHNTP